MVCEVTEGEPTIFDASEFSTALSMVQTIDTIAMVVLRMSEELFTRNRTEATSA
jgi:hypothetical protein